MKVQDWLFTLTQAGRQLWLRVAAYSVLGLVTALAAAVFRRWVPEDLALKIGTDAVDHVLSILASSMLAVATFSLATLVTAYTAVAGLATPRAAKLMVSDGRGQGSLATFVGAFIYAIVGVFALRTDYYGAQGRVILFLVTVVVLLLVVAALIRWIAQLSLLGQVDEAIDRVRHATEGGFDVRRKMQAGSAGTPDAGVAVDADRTGYVRALDLEGLQKCAGALGVTVHVEAMPGVFVHAAQPLLRFAGRANLTTDEVGRLRSAFILGERRTFDQDPRFGLTVLGQIAAKALSPGVNDPGTAIDVVATGVGLLTRWVREAPARDPTTDLPNLTFQPLRPEDLLDDLFTPIATYGAGDAVVGERLQEALAALAALGHAPMTAAAREHSALALERAMEKLTLDADKARLMRAAPERAGAR